ncbi:2849_t:CDS:2 [Rhizophagus irregularis]|nr:2849_t:CDS:2 [Rhizophagus irregularis]
MKKIKLKLMDKGVKLENGKNIRISADNDAIIEIQDLYTQQFQIEEESSEKSTDKRRYKDGEIPELYFSSNSWDYNSNILHCCRSWRLGDWANLRVLQSKLRVPMTDTDISLYSELKKNLASIALSDVARSRGKHGYF